MRLTWQLRAACVGNPVPLWDESVHGEHRTDATRRHKAAIAICKRCPVATECLADVNWSIDEGVRGGVKLPFKKTAYRPRADWPAWARQVAS